ncbi:uncharacterized protein NPIL_121171 [Nephila pilipes]|uniref:Uncharacterized protein n=1 Tax=Nephila pilipes TaxID=299642 RepID=A0A8X6MJT5_NEPPI|nr:uncharacterized protein NPIL_121171 [Nephila pilipes]
MNRSQSFLENVFAPIMFIFLLMGMETVSCPQSFTENKLCNWIWNLPKLIFKLSLSFVVVLQFFWLFLFSEYKSEWSTLADILLHTSIYISLVQSRQKIQLLQIRLSKISTIFLSVLKWKALKLSSYVYCVFMLGVSITLMISLHNSTIKQSFRHSIRNSTYVPEQMKEYFTIIREISQLTAIAVTSFITIAFTGYYCLVCICLKLFFSEFILKSEALIAQYNYQRILKIYQKLSQLMTFANDFLSYPVFINVLCSMIGLFTFSYTFVFYPQNEYAIYIIILLGIFHYSLSLVLSVILAADCNRTSNLARRTVVSLPGWFPQQYQMLKMLIRQRYKNEFVLTLWKIYVIDESLLVSALGTLVTYGFLVGNMYN